MGEGGEGGGDQGGIASRYAGPTGDNRHCGENGLRYASRCRLPLKDRTMSHRPLNDADMALITVLCEDGEKRCGVRVTAARTAGDKEAEKAAVMDQWRYRSLRFKMFSPAS
jgi:hypothetical protein